MNKKIIFSHESDIDGLGNIILAKLAFTDIDYVLLPDVEALEITFRKYIETKSLDEYDQIFVTDLSLYDPALTMAAESDLKDKTLVFDHHQRAIASNMNRYPFTKVIEEDEKGKKCATSLFYEYLTENNYLKRTEALDTFVEYVRLEDTWDWKKVENGTKAHDLGILLNILGKDEYVNEMLKKLRENEKFYYTDKEEMLLKEKKDTSKRNLEIIMSNAIYKIDEDNNKFVIVNCPYEYRNEISEYIIDTKNPNNIKYILIIALDKGEYGQKSYRRVDENIDVNKIAMRHGGGGHPGAAAVGITKEQRQAFDLMPLNEGLSFLEQAKYE